MREKRLRARELGIVIGEMETGRFNAITDVDGVRVGHSTIIKGDGPLIPGEGPIRTGVTAIIPHGGNPYFEKVKAAAFVYNGLGTTLGLDVIRHFGYIETPILSTDTLNVWSVADALLEYMVEEYSVPRTIWVNPVVGETFGGYLNDVYGRHVHKKHVFEALDRARSPEGIGPVAEGNVGGGTAMLGYGFKGGIGTASRVLDDLFTIGVLVQLNCVRSEDLLLNGVPVGKELKDLKPDPRIASGSIMIYIATDLKLTSRQLWRVARRAVLGLARTGSFSNVTSGDYVIAFSTGKKDIDELHKRELEYELDRRPWIKEAISPEMAENWLNPVFKATVEATEEAIINALFMAETMVGRDGNTSLGIPLDQVREVMVKYGKL
jgi:D-aminopeptidase